MSLRDEAAHWAALAASVGPVPTAVSIGDQLGFAPTIGGRGTTFVGDARLFRLDPPLEGYEYVIVSATAAYSVAETLIFGASAVGNVKDWGPLKGSLYGTRDIAGALRSAGYEIDDSADPR
jgi:hypothetical protein